MSNITEAEDILAEFFRGEVPEVTREGLANRQTTDSQSFSGDGSTKVFTLTNTPIAINSVTVGSTVQNKHLAYAIDLDNKLITFGTAPTSGTNNVVVSYERGSLWINPDKPRDDLSESKYPRMGVMTITQSENPMGVGVGGPYWMDGVYQIDVVTYKGQKCIINGETKEGQDVANYIGRQAISALTRGTLTNLGLTLHTPRIITNIPLPFDEEKNQFRRLIEVQLNAQDIGKQEIESFVETFANTNQKGSPTTADWDTTNRRLAMHSSSNRMKAYNKVAKSLPYYSNGNNFQTILVTATETKFGRDRIIYQLSTNNSTWQTATLGTALTLTTPANKFYWRVVFIGNGANATYIENLTFAATLS